jgi:DNA invertase Pin-like site-specific DNA recombinase
MIRERVLAGLARAKEQGISLGRRRLEDCVERGTVFTTHCSGNARVLEDLRTNSALSS